MDSTTKAVVTALWLSLGLFVLYPIVRLLWIAFSVDGSFTLANFMPVITIL